MSGYGTFSHIYQDEPADPLSLQPSLFFSLLSKVLEGFMAAHSAFRLKTSDFTRNITGIGNYGNLYQTGAHWKLSWPKNGTFSGISLV